MTYELVCDGRDVDLGDMKYLLSPQDLAAYALLPELIAAGVSAFKIEGRLKTAEYVANTTRHYRQAIDDGHGRPAGRACRRATWRRWKFRSPAASPTAGSTAATTRPWCPGVSSSKRGVFLGRGDGRRAAAAWRSSWPRPSNAATASSSRRRSEDAEQGGRVYEVFQRRPLASTESVAAGVVELAFGHGALDCDAIQPGQKLWKTDDPELARRLRKSFSGSTPQRRVPLDVTVDGGRGPSRSRSKPGRRPGPTCRLESPQPLEEARKHPLTAEMLREQLGRLGGTVYELRAWRPNRRPADDPAERVGQAAARVGRSGLDAARSGRAARRGRAAALGARDAARPNCRSRHRPRAMRFGERRPTARPDDAAAIARALPLAWRSSRRCWTAGVRS